MKISIEKSSFLFNEVDEDTRAEIFSPLPYKMDPISVGFKYLGYYLKPLGYCTNDWRWIIKRFEKRISNWTYRLLSLGGRLILMKSVLMGLAVYWLTLARIPKSILHCLRRSIFNFLWEKSHGKTRCHLVDWQVISRPYDRGGWNILNLEWFSLALRLKCFEMVLFGNGIWSHIIKFKYLKNRLIVEWIRSQTFTV